MNGAAPSQYTALETLLFFQALRAQNPTLINFKVISAELKSVPAVSHDATFDAQRLGANALQTLYLNLVKEEARKDLENSNANTENGVDGGISPGSRKRKAPSPNVPTVEDAAKHSHLLPGLLSRLYARFREDIVAEIRQEERRYDILSREIDEIERGDWDERLRRQTSVATDPIVPSKSILVGTEEHDAQQNDQAKPSPPTVNGAAPGQQSQDSRPSSARASIDALVNHDPEVDTAQATSHSRKPSSSMTSLPSLSEMAPEHLASQQSPNPNRLLAQQMQTPQLPPSRHPGTGYHGSPIMQHQSAYGPQFAHPGVAQGLSPSPKLQSAMSQSPSSPRRMLPLPPGMKQSPVMQNGMPNHHGPQPLQPAQYPSPNQRLPPAPLPPHDRQNTRGPAPPHLPAPHGYQQNAYPQYQSAPQPYPLHQQSPAPYPVRASQQGGLQLPPFQIAAPDTHKIQQQQQPSQQVGTPHARSPAPHTPRTAGPGYGQYSPYPQPQQQQSQTAPRPNSLTHSVLASLKRDRRTTWKFPGQTPIVRPKSPSQPLTEPLSPMKRRATLAAKVEDTTSVEERRPNRRLTEGPEISIRQTDHTLEPPPKPTAGTKKASRRTRGNSVASSVVASSTRGRTRSQSVVSQLGDVQSTAEKPAGRKVKKEPSTPAEMLQDDDTTTVESTPIPSRLTRHRPGTTQSQVPSSGLRDGHTSSPAEDEAKEEDAAAQDYTPASSNVIHATRNFQRMSAVILNEIAAHRHGGQFQRPVREKDAPGYKDIIKRPQDLKSIKAAITAGTRAIAAATTLNETTDSPAGTPAKDGGSLTLERTSDLMPPKAIVNSSQLEKEVMRMFANAVMFNPGEGKSQDGGFIQDAREMAEDIEAKVRDWRGVERERQTEGREEDEDGSGTAKRRKL